jgi:hypothetical protein
VVLPAASSPTIITRVGFDELSSLQNASTGERKRRNTLPSALKLQHNASHLFQKEEIVKPIVVVVVYSLF